MMRRAIQSAVSLAGAAHVWETTLRHKVPASMKDQFEEVWLAARVRGEDPDWMHTRGRVR